jgi:hypothetical protein
MGNRGRRTTKVVSPPDDSNQTVPPVSLDHPSHDEQPESAAPRIPGLDVHAQARGEQRRALQGPRSPVRHPDQKRVVALGRHRNLHLRPGLPVGQSVPDEVRERDPQVLDVDVGRQRCGGSMHEDPVALWARGELTHGLGGQGGDVGGTASDRPSSHRPTDDVLDRTGEVFDLGERSLQEPAGVDPLAAGQNRLEGGLHREQRRADLVCCRGRPEIVVVIEPWTGARLESFVAHLASLIWRSVTVTAEARPGAGAPTLEVPAEPTQPGVAATHGTSGPRAFSQRTITFVCPPDGDLENCEWSTSPGRSEPRCAGSERREG